MVIDLIFDTIAFLLFLLLTYGVYEIALYLDNYYKTHTRYSFDELKSHNF